MENGHINRLSPISLVLRYNSNAISHLHIDTRYFLNLKALARLTGSEAQLKLNDTNMFTTTKALTLLASILVCSSAKPIERRDPGDVLLCTGENYTGDCLTINFPFNECTELPALVYKNLGSLKVAPFAYCRLTFTMDTCRPTGDLLIFPETTVATLHNLPYGEQGVIDAGSTATTILCQRCDACPGQ